MKTSIASSLLLLSHYASAAPYDESPGAFPDYLCKFNLPDSTGTVFSYDLTPVGSSTLSIVNGPYNYTFQVCGVSSFKCTPDWGEPWPFSPGFQLQPPSSDLSEGDGCYDPSTNTTVPCTYTCYGLGVGSPLHSLLDASNGATGGLETTYLGTRPTANNGGKCPFDPVRGTEFGRTLNVIHKCNASMAPGEIIVTNQAENPTCFYNLFVTSAAACGTQVSVPLSLNAGNPLPAYAPGAGPMSDYLCNPILVDTNSKSWSYNFSQLYNSVSDYFVADSIGNTLFFNVCGYTSTTCTPQYAVAASFGTMVVAFPYPVPTPVPASACYFSNGTTAPCGGPCRTVGDAASPKFTLVDQTNGATGGVTMWFKGLYANADEPTQCSFDPTGNPIPSVASVTIQCDNSILPNQLQTVSASVSPGCVYNVVAKSGAACGV